jgi:hypothetical protein
MSETTQRTSTESTDSTVLGIPAPILEQQLARAIEQSVGPETSAALAATMGVSDEEWARIVSVLGRKPSYTELGVFSVMWSEHCSYKSSRIHLKKLPTTGPKVVQGPGENAGAVDIGDGYCAVFKMESHNHPSYIEPYQGAATGVGGILRDVFTMGARPVANLNSLRFGRPEHPKTPGLLRGVVAGIGGYGNAIGVPTVGGELQFDASYDGNMPRQRVQRRHRAQRGPLLRQGRGRRQRDPLRRLAHGPRRHPRRDDGERRVRRGERQEAPDRAGR